ncbi:MAG: hypothetical protein ACK587_11870 [Cyanobacteriota bacterium]
MPSDENPSSQRRDFTKWLTASVGVATGITGIFQVYYKEIFAPAKVPVNIALGLEISPLTPNGNTAEKIIPALMQIKISNTGNKSVYLKNPIWMAYGIYRTWEPRSAGAFTIPTTPKRLEDWCDQAKEKSNSELEAAFVKCWNTSLAPKKNDNLEPFTDRIELPPKTMARDKRTHSRELIATGPIGKENELKQGQVIQSHILIPVSTIPKYDYLEAIISVPTVSGVSPDRAKKVASMLFINLQDMKGLSSSSTKVYQQLRGFCTLEPRRPSLVDVLNTYTLPRVGANEVATRPGDRITGSCYSWKDLPRGDYLNRLKEWGVRNLGEFDLNRFGAQFYDATYEVPLNTYGESESGLNRQDQP